MTLWLTMAAFAGGGTEVCNGIDDDGNGVVDEGVASIGGVAYSTVHDAVDAATGGAVISVCPGIHYEATTALVDVPVTIQGVAGPSATVLHGSFSVADGVLAVLTGLEIDSEAYAHAAYVGQQSVLIGVDLVVNTSRSGFYLDKDAQLLLSGSHLSVGDYGLDLHAGASADLGDSEIKGGKTGVWMAGDASLVGGTLFGSTTGIETWGAGPVTVTDTVVSEAGFDGIDVNFSDLVLHGVVIDGSGWFGLYLPWSTLLASARLESTQITGSGSGGIVSYGRLELVESTVSGNQGGCGGGIYTTADVVGDGLSRVEANSAWRGGGVCSESGSVSGLVIAGNTAEQGGGVWANLSKSETLTDLEITDNVATEAGGGIWAESPVTITDSAILRNQAPLGGGAYVPPPETWGASSLGAFCTDWGMKDDDNADGDVATQAGKWSVAAEEVHCDFASCWTSASTCGLDGGGDTVKP